ncbi:MAG: HAD family hydrolase [Clostridiales bacterium]|nr:HAD family hydrolase [Clostridiales bacterium]
MFDILPCLAYTQGMRYKLALSDFDGTLLRRDDTISPRTVRAIAGYTAAGGTFCVSTGRAFSSIAQRLNELGLGDCVVMSCQGALFKRSSGETLKVVPMDREGAVAFLRKAEALDLPCQFYTEDEIYAPYVNERNEEYFRMNRLTPVLTDNVSQFASTCNMPILKTLAVIPPERREELLAAFSGIAEIKVFASHPMLLEAVSTDAGKGNGLKHACAYLGISPHECVAFGDEQNDVEMLLAADLGVAVANAVTEAKQAAGLITDDCDDDGVAKVLEKITASEL